MKSLHGKLRNFTFCLLTLAIPLLFLRFGAGGVSALAQGPGSSTDDTAIGDAPVIREHLDQASINDGRIRFQELFDAGERLFAARFNILDGQGRPSAVGGGMPVKRVPGVDRTKLSRTPAFVQSSGPTANSCAGCHFQPFVGGAGDFAVNVHVTANDLDPPTESFATEFGDERTSLGLIGAGVIELLAREMTADLHRIRDEAIQQAVRVVQPVTAALTTKGVDFGRITVMPTGMINTSAVQGVDPDLIVKPFHQKGVVISLRQFSNNAFNHHLGMQSVERFGRERTGTDDFDEDGVRDEISVGDVTAISVWQAALGIPGRVYPASGNRRRAMDRGEELFSTVGCASCHRPFLVLNNPVFTEPGPFNPAGNLRLQDVARPFAFDVTREGMRPRPSREPNGTVLVRAFTDLKRHVIGDSDFPHFLNERIVHAGVPTNQFITRKLWDIGNTEGYGHRGDLTTISEAILAHGGEARAARDGFARLPKPDQAAIVEFLKSMQILPEGSASVFASEEQVNHLKRQKHAVEK